MEDDVRSKKRDEIVSMRNKKDRLLLRLIDEMKKRVHAYASVGSASFTRVSSGSTQQFTASKV